MKFECISINGFAGDRTPEAMLECQEFATAFSNHFDLPFELIGEPASAMDLQWDTAILKSERTFKSIVEHLGRILDGKRIPILITPRCASSIASLPVIAAEYPEVVVLYFDAHGDLHTPETSESGYLGGMPIAAALGEWDSGYGAGLKCSNLVHIGGRDFDPAERLYIEKNCVNTISKKDIEGDLLGLRKIVQEMPVYIHLDVDVFDPTEVSAEYTVEDGLFRRHVRKIVNLVIEEAKLVGVEITELSPRNSSERQQSYAALFDSFHDIRI